MNQPILYFMTKIIDPYGSELVEDYAKVIKEFGLDSFSVKKFPKPNKLMRRGVVFAGRDLEIVSKCIKEKKPFYVLSGIMPTNDKIHFGTKMVVENIRYFQEQGAETYILIADLEAAAARGVSLEEGRKRAMDFHIPCTWHMNSAKRLRLMSSGQSTELQTLAG